jgi:HSP20 family protein
MAREKNLARSEPREETILEPWDSFRDMERGIRDFFFSPGSVFRSPMAMFEKMHQSIAPDVDMRETDKEIIVSATVPGMEPDDISIDVTKEWVTITGERKKEEERPEETYHLRQQRYGVFKVSYALPAEVKAENVTAVYKNGILEVTMPKAEVSEMHRVKVEIEK